MNIQTLEKILESFEQFRRDVLSGEYDIQMTLIGILSFLTEQIRYEIDKNKIKDIYK